VKQAAQRILFSPRMRELASGLPDPVRAVARDTLFSDVRAKRQWLRTIMNRDVAALLAEFEERDVDVVEVSGRLRESPHWRSYTRVEWPEFDLCSPGDLPGQFDLVICEQVLEHVRNPWTAVRTLRALCRPGGHVLVSTPFLVRLHGSPEDYWRFTPDGLRILLEDGGLTPLWIRSWGNRRCIRANLDKWVAHHPWNSLRNEPELPLVVWALAQPTP